MSERQNNFFKAKLADQADRHTDMPEAMKSTVLIGEVLTVEERNMFSAAYKNHIGKVRSSWRVLNSIEWKETGVVSVEHLGVIPQRRGLQAGVEAVAVLLKWSRGIGKGINVNVSAIFEHCCGFSSCTYDAVFLLSLDSPSTALVSPF
ncbi:14-3-3 protein epsilon-like [Drosophila obscura]|uniref:14-3-3 protein epsilon-like n=1 Tax=Drosophila obscura TaxID=7282 RepID=UPI001BB259C9|nr:14-3-3 protein epsilon-like [Drosophila obscura]